MEINSNTNRKEKIINALKELFSIKNIIIYIIMFLVSTVSIKGTILPFGLALLAGAMGATIPIFVIFIVGMIATLIFYGSDGFMVFTLTSIIFFIITLIFKPKTTNYNRNEEFKVGPSIAIATFIGLFIMNLRQGLTTDGIFISLISAVLVFAIYKVFVNALALIRDFGKVNAFSTEEIVALAFIFAIVACPFISIKVLNVSIGFIFAFFITLAFGWKNNVKIGFMVGVFIGLTLILVENINPTYLIVFILMGALAGIIKGQWKIYLIIGLLIGNIIISVALDTSIEALACFRELFIASLFLIFVPGNVIVNKKEEDILLLGDGGDKRFKYYEENEEDKKDANNENFELKGEVFIDGFLETFKSYEDNVFYDDVVDSDDILGDIFDKFKDKAVLTENDIIDALNTHNIYTVLKDSLIKSDMQDLVKVANKTYHEMKFNDLKNDVKEKSKEEIIINTLYEKGFTIKDVYIKHLLNGKCIIDIEQEYNEGVRDESKIKLTQDVLKDVMGEEFKFRRDKNDSKLNKYIQSYSNPDKFSLQVGVSKGDAGNDKEVNVADIEMMLDDGKYMLCLIHMQDINDIINNAKDLAQDIVKAFEKGFDGDFNVKLKNINDKYDLNKYDLNIQILDLYKGEGYLYKLNNPIDFIKTNKNEVDNVNDELYLINEGDTLITINDKTRLNKEQIKETVKTFKGVSAKKLSSIILENIEGVNNKDITVIVSKVIKKN